MKVIIYKYQLEVRTEQKLTVPACHHFLTLRVQHGVPCLWAAVSVESLQRCEYTTLDIDCFGTGEEQFEDGVLERRYLGTAMVNGYVWHYFTRLPHR